MRVAFHAPFFFAFLLTFEGFLKFLLTPFFSFESRKKEKEKKRERKEKEKTRKRLLRLLKVPLG